MKIKSFTYEDKFRHWRLERVEFSDLTLLVGASGVGKTQILQAIYNMTRIALGASLNGVKWEIELEVDPQVYYIWSGEFENLGSEANNAIVDVLEEKQPRIIYESITHNNVDIIKRDETDIYFREIPTIRLDQNQSVLPLIKDNPITLIEISLKLIIFNVHTYSIYRSSLHQRNSKVWLEMYPDLRSIRDSGETILRKLYLCSLVDYEVFNAIKQDFMDVFPFVENIRFQQIKRPATIQ